MWYLCRATAVLSLTIGCWDIWWDHSVYWLLRFWKSVYLLLAKGDWIERPRISTVLLSSNPVKLHVGLTNHQPKWTGGQIYFSEQMDPPRRSPAIIIRKHRLSLCNKTQQRVEKKMEYELWIWSQTTKFSERGQRDPLGTMWDDSPVIKIHWWGHNWLSQRLGCRVKSQVIYNTQG